MVKKLALFASPGRVAEPTTPALIEKGWDISISYRKNGSSEKVAKKLQEQYGEKVNIIEAEISNLDGAKKFVKESLKNYSNLERLALINIASNFPKQEDFKKWEEIIEIPDEDWKYFKSNFGVMQNMTNEILDWYNQESKKNINLKLDIINFADERSQRYFDEKNIHPFSRKVIDFDLNYAKENGIGFLQGSGVQGRDYNPYLLSKLLIAYATRELALEYSGGNVKINAIAPGVMSESPNDTIEQAKKYAKKVSITGAVPGHNLARDSILYLLEMTSNMTGSIIMPDGGLHLKWREENK
jgi:NAD(P)-dependent dehydrogenase (short-subunit alcohol dehydrogenase family)